MKIKLKCKEELQGDMDAILKESGYDVSYDDEYLLYETEDGGSTPGRDSRGDKPGA